MQVHYNLLVGDKPVKNSLILRTVPLSTRLLPLHLDLILAPPNIPCPTGVTGPLCNRAAELANVGQRFGQTAIEEVNGIEEVCGKIRPIHLWATRLPATRQIGRVAISSGSKRTCTSWVGPSRWCSTREHHEALTVLNVPNYDFHDQRSYNLATPIPVTAGEPVRSPVATIRIWLKSYPSCVRPRPTS